MEFNSIETESWEKNPVQGVERLENTSSERLIRDEIIGRDEDFSKFEPCHFEKLARPTKILVKSKGDMKNPHRWPSRGSI